MNEIIQQVREHLEVRDSLISELKDEIELYREIIEEQGEVIEVMKDQNLLLKEQLQMRDQISVLKEQLTPASLNAQVLQTIEEWRDENS